MQISSVSDLGTEVRRKRRSLKLTLAQTAMVSGVSMSFLRSLERGKPSCHFAPVLQVLTALGISIHLHGTAPEVAVTPAKTRAARTEASE